MDQLAFAAHGQFFLQTQVLVHYVYMRGAVTGVEIFAVACDAPAFAWIVRLAEQFEAVGRIAENFAVPPGQDIYLPVEADAALNEIFLWEIRSLQRPAAFQFHLPEGGEPVQAGALEESSVLEEKALGVGKGVVRVGPDDLGSVLPEFASAAGDEAET